MELETAEARDEQPPSNPRRGLRWLALIAVVAAVVATVAYLESDKGEPSASATSTTIPRLSDFVGDTPESNEVAPDFEVPTLAGGTFSLADHQATDGRPVFLNLWASWCFPCRAEMPDIDKAARAHPEVFFIGVAVADDNEAAAKFAKEIGVQYTIGFDRDDQVANGYPVLGMPGTFLISADGIVLKTIFGGVDEDEIDELLDESFGI
jgi:thiol-disulfide isomerase/thioredoxin